MKVLSITQSILRLREYLDKDNFQAFQTELAIAKNLTIGHPEWDELMAPICMEAIEKFTMRKS